MATLSPNFGLGLFFLVISVELPIPSLVRKHAKKTRIYPLRSTTTTTSTSNSPVFFYIFTWLVCVLELCIWRDFESNSTFVLFCQQVLSQVTVSLSFFQIGYFECDFFIVTLCLTALHMFFCSLYRRTRNNKSYSPIPIIVPSLLITKVITHVSDLTWVTFEYQTKQNINNHNKFWLFNKKPKIYLVPFN